MDIKERFKGVDLESIVLHWDGKLLPSITGKEMEERLPIIITSKDTEQILTIPTLPDSTGKSQAQAMYQALLEWDLLDKVEAFCCDTTASNLGKFNGAASLLEGMLGRDILYLPCRHHIFEVVLKGVFDCKMPKSSSPNVTLFQDFQKKWPHLDKKKFSCADKDTIKKVDSDNIVEFCKKQLLENQPRDDYRELLQLSIIFLGGNLNTPVSFRMPGAIHHARWMAKAIYSLKIYLFRSQFDISAELQGLEKICLFIVGVYIEAWYQAPMAIKAPKGDLDFIKKILKFEKVDKEISHIASKKIVNHRRSCIIKFL
uniref:Uncharacterized protein n=1 Tax=Cacopsylla melanoneura TaxID=428564 RepID=A0A8D8MC19_9HEMI